MFPAPKNSRQNTTTHQQFTTTSPQKTITKPPVFLKTPEKTPLHHAEKNPKNYFITFTGTPSGIFISN